MSNKLQQEIFSAVSLVQNISENKDVFLLKKKKKTKTESEKKCRLSLLSPGLSKMRMCVYELFKHGGWVRKEEGDGSDGQYRKKRMSLLVITSTTLYIWKILSREAFGECFFAVCYIKSLSWLFSEKSIIKMYLKF